LKDIRFDATGTARCWNCGSAGLTQKRTFRSKVMFGVGALITKKKLKCQRCGEYNDTGNGKPYTGPAARKYRREWEQEQTAARGQASPVAPGPQSVAEELERLAQLHQAGSISDTEFATAKAQLLGNT
jgi:hypothetical protein